MTQVIILSVEMGAHLSVYSTDFYVLLDFACVHACISVVPMSNKNLFNGRESELCVCILGMVLQISRAITALTCSQSIQCSICLLVKVLKFAGDVLCLKVEY